MRQEHDAQRQGYTALIQTIRDYEVFGQTLEDRRTQEKASQDALHKVKDDRIKRLEEDLKVQQEDSFAKFERYEVQFAGYENKIQATIAESNERFNKAQNMANERIFQLEASLDAEKKSGQEIREKLEGDLQTARQHIENLLSSIRSTSYELQMYRNRARDLRHAGPSIYPTLPMPMPIPMPTPFPTAQTGMQFSQGQSQFAPHQNNILGFPPNRTSGFVGDTPPPGWRGGEGMGGGIM